MQAREVLFIIELILWTPTLGLAIYVATKQGFHRQLGWFSLILLGIFRLLGAATGIASISSPTEGLIETSIISESVGLISLVGALTGLIFRVHNNLPPAHSLLAPLPARIVHLATMAALILSILAGSDFASTNSQSDIAQGHKFIKIAVGLLSGVFVFSGGLALYTRAMLMRHISAPGEPRLVNCTSAALPFIALRLIYAWLGACLPDSSAFDVFSNGTGATVARALMQIAAELVVAWLFLWAGCTVPKSQAPHHRPNHALGGGYGGTRGGKTAMLQRGLEGVWGHGTGEGQGQQQREKVKSSVDEV
ncbi:uncharacterized protein HMPREF1541_07454 [Cyphellophora europaea CBS 101466]|uniref:DUF7702 domain-containing protein n=1 Tax=Cyphellophora europaea (strain CBS 101466) TaxID=1220924 RepID=W2RMV0_CYPE1|nr:uncharacterized protein HMPREF1541_07454 [Cyphellophora europaea CBS 101466]ETN37831.1 hypothetical protein HMPREF1541_07454 [Cyphellophora europaea CBS 101466]